jgi:acetyl-CoA carboxylase biotin carboxyl carrier protein
MDYEKLKVLIELVGSSPIAELELDDGVTKVRITRSIVGGVPVDAGGTAEAAAATRQEHLAPTSPTRRDSTPDRGMPVPSPMTGVFYRRPSPTDTPFVEVGSHVEGGDTLALVEAMKTLNKVVAERSGLIREILVEDGAVVEDDQHLFIID